jgi:hypothetical protein
VANAPTESAVIRFASALFGDVCLPTGTVGDGVLRQPPNFVVLVAGQRPRCTRASGVRSVGWLASIRVVRLSTAIAASVHATRKGQP